MTAFAEMGSLKVAGGDAGSDTSFDGTASRTVVAGAGTHPFGITVRMGSASIVVAS